MPEPVTIIVGGIALYSLLKGSGSAPSTQQTQQALTQAPAATTSGNQPISGPITPGDLSTNGSVVASDNGIALSDALATPQLSTDMLPVPADLVSALDNQTALMFRAYAAMNPDDFQAFLDQYAGRVVMRNDLMFEVLTNPPDQPMQVTPAMLAGMGNAAYKIVQAFNGVAAGKSVDLFGVAASAAGSIPGLNRDFVSALQGVAMAYRAIQSFQEVVTIAHLAGVEVTNLTGLVSQGAGIAGAYPGLAALPLSGVLMAVGLVVDIGFTIIGDKPDLQKAIDVALDVASLAVLFIPVIGVVIAIVIQLVKFIIDLFGDDLFGGGMSHEQREILETARYGENLNPMFPQLSDAYTPRELWRTIVEWGSGYCGGQHVVAMAVSLVLHTGDVVPVNGQPYTVPPELDGFTLGFGDNDRVGGCYWLQGTPFAQMSNDEQAWALGALAPVNGVIAMAQAGIVDWRKTQFNDPTQKLIMARATPMRDFLVKYRLSLDQCDQIALEYRAQPHLNVLASAYGWGTWQELLGSVLAQEWAVFSATVSDGTLTDFANQNGYPTMYAFRAAALASFESLWSRGQQALAVARATKASWDSYIDQQYQMLLWQQASSNAP